jgi:DNA primase
MALPTSFLEELRARTPLPALVGRKVRLVRSGRQHKGCCPFHGEKTASFYVYDDHFHCFGCGAHGDAISFVMQSDGASFTEAVQRLAAECGLDVPAATPEAEAAERRRLDIFAVLAAAGSLFRRLLRAPEGARALGYLRGRDIGDETIDAWGLGYAPAGRGAFFAAMREFGIEPAQLVEAGLATPAEEGSRPYFQDRVIFPIADARGRIVSFGGRTLGEATPKYLNGPDSPVFRKRFSLYGLDRARAGLRAGAALVVAEGYMDVLRLHQSGFAGAVAPLGTALTAEQLETLWSFAPAPILCFDGDKAGGRAAARAIDLALPLIEPERTLRIAALPLGEDPDSLVRARGAAAMQAVLDSAATLTQALFAQIREATPGEGPERRALLHKRLQDAAARVANPVLARELRYALLQSFFAQSRRRNGNSGSPVPSRLAPGRLAPSPARAPTTPGAERMRNLVGILLRHPALLHDLEEAFALVDLPARLRTLRDTLRDWAAVTPEPLDSATLMTHLQAAGQAGAAEQALADRPLPSASLPDAMPAEAEARWWHFFSLLDLGGLEAQVEQAKRDFAENPTEQTQRRLIALRRAHQSLRDGDMDPD